MRKKGTKNKNYSAEFKISVIMDMRENHLGYRETARKYGLVTSSMGGAISPCTDGSAYILKKERRDL